MSSLILPEGLKKAVNKKKKEENENPDMERVPQATGWRMVILTYKG